MKIIITIQNDSGEDLIMRRIKYTEGETQKVIGDIISDMIDSIELN